MLPLTSDSLAPKERDAIIAQYASVVGLNMQSRINDKLEFPFRMNDATLTELQEYFPHRLVSFNPIKDTGHPIPACISHYANDHIENFIRAENKAGRKVCEISPTLRSHKRADHNCFLLQTPEDKARYASHTDHSSLPTDRQINLYVKEGAITPGLCYRGVQKCSVKADTIVSVNTLYDITLQDYADAVINKGSTNGMHWLWIPPSLVRKEWSPANNPHYSLNVNGDVVMFHVKDASKTYVHNLKNWSKWLRTTMIDLCDYQITIEFVENHGDFWCLQMQTVASAPTVIPTRIYPLSKIAHDVVLIPDFYTAANYNFCLKFETICYLSMPRGAFEAIIAYLDRMTAQNFNLSNALSYMYSFQHDIRAGKHIIWRKWSEHADIYIVISVSLYILSAINRFHQTQIASKSFKHIQSSADAGYIRRRADELVAHIRRIWYVDLEMNDGKNTIGAPSEATTDDADILRILDMRPIYPSDIAYNEVFKSARLKLNALYHPPKRIVKIKRPAAPSHLHWEFISKTWVPRLRSIEPDFHPWFSYRFSKNHNGWIPRERTHYLHSPDCDHGAGYTCQDILNFHWLHLHQGVYTHPDSHGKSIFSHGDCSHNGMNCVEFECFRASPLSCTNSGCDNGRAHPYFSCDVLKLTHPQPRCNLHPGYSCRQIFLTHFKGTHLDCFINPHTKMIFESFLVPLPKIVLPSAPPMPHGKTIHTANDSIVALNIALIKAAKNPPFDPNVPNGDSRITHFRRELLRELKELFADFQYTELKGVITVKHEALTPLLDRDVVESKSKAGALSGIFRTAYHFDISVTMDDNFVVLNSLSTNSTQKITMTKYDYLADNYVGEPDYFIASVYLLLQTYEGYFKTFTPPVGSTATNFSFGAHCSASLHPDYFNKYKIDAEVFASPLNTRSKIYFSRFHADIVFGSKGNAFDIDLVSLRKGVYLINPPFTFYDVKCREYAKIRDLIQMIIATGNPLYICAPRESQLPAVPNSFYRVVEKDCKFIDGRSHLSHTYGSYVGKGIVLYKIENLYRPTAPKVGFKAGLQIRGFDETLLSVERTLSRLEKLYLLDLASATADEITIACAELTIVADVRKNLTSVKDDYESNLDHHFGVCGHTSVAECAKADCFRVCRCRDCLWSLVDWLRFSKLAKYYQTKPVEKKISIKEPIFYDNISYCEPVVQSLETFDPLVPADFQLGNGHCLLRCVSVITSIRPALLLDYAIARIRTGVYNDLLPLPQALDLFRRYVGGHWRSALVDILPRVFADVTFRDILICSTIRGQYYEHHINAEVAKEINPIVLHYNGNHYSIFRGGSNENAGGFPKERALSKYNYLLENIKREVKDPILLDVSAAPGGLLSICKLPIHAAVYRGPGALGFDSALAHKCLSDVQYYEDFNQIIIPAAAPNVFVSDIGAHITEPILEKYFIWLYTVLKGGDSIVVKHFMNNPNLTKLMNKFQKSQCQRVPGTRAQSDEHYSFGYFYNKGSNTELHHEEHLIDYQAVITPKMYEASVGLDFDHVAAAEYNNIVKSFDHSTDVSFHFRGVFGIPGCGKSTMIRKRFPDAFVIVPSVELKADWNKQGHSKVHTFHIALKCYNGELLVVIDEAQSMQLSYYYDLYKHCSAKNSFVKFILTGDVDQINAINYRKHADFKTIFDISRSYLTDSPISNTMLVSHRMPQDVVKLLNHLYKRSYSSTSKVVNSIRFSEESPDSFRLPIMRFNQQTHASIPHNITIHQSMGTTFNGLVWDFDTKSITSGIMESPGHITVGISRHLNQLVVTGKYNCLEKEYRLSQPILNSLETAGIIITSDTICPKLIDHPLSPHIVNTHPFMNTVSLPIIEDMLVKLLPVYNRPTPLINVYKNTHLPGITKSDTKFHAALPAVLPERQFKVHKKISECISFNKQHSGSTTEMVNAMVKRYGQHVVDMPLHKARAAAEELHHTLAENLFPKEKDPWAKYMSYYQAVTDEEIKAHSLDYIQNLQRKVANQTKSAKDAVLKLSNSFDELRKYTISFFAKKSQKFGVKEFMDSLPKAAQGVSAVDKVLNIVFAGHTRAVAAVFRRQLADAKNILFASDMPEDELSEWVAEREFEFRDCDASFFACDFDEWDSKNNRANVEFDCMEYEFIRMPPLLISYYRDHRSHWTMCDAFGDWFVILTSKVNRLSGEQITLHGNTKQNFAMICKFIITICLYYAIIKGDDSLLKALGFEFSETGKKFVVDLMGFSLKIEFDQVGEVAGKFVTSYGLARDFFRAVTKFLSARYRDQEHLNQSKLNVQQDISALTSQAAIEAASHAIAYHYRNLGDKNFRLTPQRARMFIEFAKTCSTYEFDDLVAVPTHDFIYTHDFDNERDPLNSANMHSNTSTMTYHNHDMKN